MLFCRHILLIYVFLIYLNGSDTVDVIGFQVVRFRDNDKLNMSVVLRNIPRGGKKAKLYFRKYSLSTFPYKSVNVIGSEAVFENVDINLYRNAFGNEMHTVVTLLNNTEYGNKEIMKGESITILGDNEREVRHVCLQSCTLIIDYQETPSTSTHITDTPDTKSAQDKRDAVSNVPSQVTPPNADTPDTKSAQDERDAVSNVPSQVTPPNADTPDTKSAQDERDAVSNIPSQVTPPNADTPDTKSAQDERDAVSNVPSQVTPPNAELDWKSICLVITTIVIIILLIIIILKVTRTQKSKPQGVLRSYSSSSHSVKYMDLVNKYDTGLKTNDENRALQTNMKHWKNNEFYVNDNYCDTNTYYSYATK